MKKTVFGIALLLLACASVQASTVTLTMSYPTATTWQVVGTSSAGDNAGIFSAGFTFTGALTSAFRGPSQGFYDGSDTSTLHSYGFTSKLGPTSGINGGSAVVSLGQGLSDPAGGYFYAVGQAAGSGNSLTAPAGEVMFGSAVNYANPVLLFNGTRASGGIVDFVQGTGNATLFKLAGQGAGQNLAPATTVNLVGVPEPSSLILAGAAGLGLTFFARRRRVRS